MKINSKKHVVVALLSCVLALCLVIAVGCNNTHEHTYETGWTRVDDSYHWHAPTCGDTTEGKDKTAHNWDNGVVTKAATENEDGVKTYTCADCGATKTEVISKISKSEAVKALDYAEYDATFSCYVNAMGGQQFAEGLYVGAYVAEYEDGYYLKLCLTKGEVTIYNVTCNTFVDVSSNPGGSLTYRGVDYGTLGIYNGDEIVTDGVFYELSDAADTCPNPADEQVRYVTAAYFPMSSLVTGQQIKLTMYVNSQVMGVQFCEENANTPDKVQTYSAYIILDGKKGEEPKATCTEDAVKIVKDEDGNIISQRTIERAKGHSFDSNGVCTVCGHKQADDFTYTLNSDESGYLISAYNPDVAAATARIPASYNDKPVVGFAAGTTKVMGTFVAVSVPGVFGNNVNIKEIILNNNITEIAAATFSGCSALEKINLEKVTTLGIAAFQNCAALTSVTLSDSLTEVSAAAFNGCAALEQFNSEQSGVCDLTNIVTLGANSFANCKSFTSVVIPDAINTTNLVFTNWESLVNVKLPSSITSLANSMFSGCAALTTLNSDTANVIDLTNFTTIGTGVFQNCKSITTVKFNSSVTSLPNYLFSGCENLVKIGESDEVALDLTQFTTVGTNVFTSCSSIKSVKFASTVSNFGQMLFMNCAALETVDFNNNTAESVTFSGSQTFMDCKSLKTLDLPQNTISIGQNFASGATALQSVSLGKITSVPNTAFNGCTSLTSVTLPNEVTKIGNYAFSGCNALQTVNIDAESNLTEIGSNAFASCYALRAFTVPSKVTKINSNSFSSCYHLFDVLNLSTIDVSSYFTYVIHTKTAADSNGAWIENGNFGYYVYNNGTSDVAVITSFIGQTGNAVLPTTVADNGTTYTVIAIGPATFYKFSATDVVMVMQTSGNITTIGDYAFYGASKLGSAYIANVTTIGKNAFTNCTSLQKVTMPKLSEIGAGAFKNCVALTSFTLSDDITADDIGTGAFEGCYALAEVINNSEIDFTNAAEGFCGGIADNALNIKSASDATILYTANNFKVAYVAATEDVAEHVILLRYTGTATEVTLPDTFMVNGKEISTYYLGAYVFGYNTTITKVTIPASVTSLSEGAFYGCTALTSVSATGVTAIPAYAFYGCSALVNFNGGETDRIDLSGIVSVGESAFSDCVAVTEVYIASSVEKIENEAFDSLTNCAKLTFAEGENNLTIGSYAFRSLGAEIEGGMEKLTLVSRIGMTNSEGAFVSSIASNAFYKINVNALVIGKGITSIEEKAFNLAAISVVYYEGAENDLQVKDTTKKENAAVTANFYAYSETDPLFDGKYWHYADGEVEVWEMV